MSWNIPLDKQIHVKDGDLVTLGDAADYVRSQFPSSPNPARDEVLRELKLAASSGTPDDIEEARRQTFDLLDLNLLTPETWRRSVRERWQWKS